METVVVQINNRQAFKFFKSLEELNVIKVLRRIPYSQVETMMKTDDDNSDNTKRLTAIQAITENINIDLTNFRFNRDDANNYD